jgi:acetyltransferase
MVTLAQKLGFKVDVQIDEGIVNLTLPLQDGATP